MKQVVKHHGVPNLEKKQKMLLVNSSNKNDIIKILGQPSSKSKFDNDTWIYIERVKSKGPIYKLGKEVLLVNNILELKYDLYGILKEKNFYDKEDMKDIAYNKNETINDISQESFVSGLLQSLRERMYGQKKN